MNCPDNSGLLAQIAGSNSDLESAAIADHLASCPACMQRYIELLEGDLKEPPAGFAPKVMQRVRTLESERRRQAMTFYVLRTAACVAACVAVGFTVLIHPPDILTRERVPETKTVKWTKDDTLFRDPDEDKGLVETIKQLLGGDNE